MGVAKKGRGNHFQNCSTSSKVLYGCQLVISGEKSFLARSATIIPFGALLTIFLENCIVFNHKFNNLWMTLPDLVMEVVKGLVGDSLIEGLEVEGPVEHFITRQIVEQPTYLYRGGGGVTGRLVLQLSHNSAIGFCLLKCFRRIVISSSCYVTWFRMVAMLLVQRIIVLTSNSLGTM